MAYNAAAVSDAVIAHQKPITLQQGRGLRDNTLGIAAGLSDAPYVQSAWHPYDGALVGDGFTGEVWSFAVDGAVGSFETPDLEDGYEYRLLCYGVSHNDGSTTRAIDIQVRRATDNGLVTAVTTGLIAGSASTSIGLELVRPREARQIHMMQGLQPLDIASSSKIKSMRVSVTGATLDAGIAYLQRRLSYA